MSFTFIFAQDKIRESKKEKYAFEVKVKMINVDKKVVKTFLLDFLLDSRARNIRERKFICIHL